MPTKEPKSKPKGISREKLAREVVKRIAYRFPNGRIYYETLEGVLDYVEGHREDVEKIAGAAQNVLVKVRNGTAHEEEPKKIGLEGRLALVDDTPEVGDLVIVTDGKTSLYAKEGSYGVVRAISGEGETANVEFYYFTGTDGQGATLPTPQVSDVRMQDIRKALVLEEGRWEVMYGNRNLSAQDKKPFAVMKSDRNLSPSTNTTGTYSAAKTVTDEERGLISGSIHYVGKAIQYVMRVTGDHLVATLALAVAVYAVNCGIQSLRNSAHETSQRPHTGQSNALQYVPAQQMLLMPAITIIPENPPRDSGTSAGDDTGQSGNKEFKIPLSEEEVLRKLKGLGGR